MITGEKSFSQAEISTRLMWYNVGRIIGSKVAAPWQVPDVVKTVAQTYIDVLKAHVEPGFKKKANVLFTMMLRPILWRKLMNNL